MGTENDTRRGLVKEGIKRKEIGHKATSNNTEGELGNTYLAFSAFEASSLPYQKNYSLPREDQNKILFDNLFYTMTREQFESFDLHFRKYIWPDGVDDKNKMKYNYDIQLWGIRGIEAERASNDFTAWPRNNAGLSATPVLQPLFFTALAGKYEHQRAALVCYTNDAVSFGGLIDDVQGVSDPTTFAFWGDPTGVGVPSVNAVMRGVGTCSNDVVCPGWNENAWRLFNTRSYGTDLKDSQGKIYEPFCRPCPRINEFWIQWLPHEASGIAFCVPNPLEQVSFWLTNDMYSTIFLWFGLFFIIWMYGIYLLRIIMRWLPFRQNYNVPILSDISETIAESVSKRPRGRPKKDL